jgi:hypothetical protein
MLPTVRKADEWELRWPWGVYVVQRPIPPDQNRRDGGPTILFDRPVQEPPPFSSSDFHCGPATLWGRVQSMGDGCRGEPFKFRPLDFGPSIKMMRTHETLSPNPVLLRSYFSEAAKRRSRCGSVRGWPVVSSHLSPGFAPQVGQRTAWVCFCVTFMAR